ncbi:MAG: tryptophan--tRNA ligase [Acidobacteriota bacterium]
MPKSRAFSGIQPSGELHIGNYFGAIQNWVRLQDEYDCIYCVVDYHAVTDQMERQLARRPAGAADSLPSRTLRMAGDLIACGIEPQRSILFVQSHVPEHTELAWILSCVASYGDLTRMTQFKDKSARSSYVSVGLFSYPVLQAADILLYRAAGVPVGEDQVQHLELARRIGRRFNSLVGQEYFPEVEPLLTEGKRIMSLAEPGQKMSKSLGPKHYIGLMENSQQSRKKIRAAVTDTGLQAGQAMSPGVANLFALLRLSAPADLVDKLQQQHVAGKLRYGDLKETVGEQLTASLRPIRERRAALTDAEILRVLTDGAGRARAIAVQTMQEVRALIGVGAARLD